MQQIRGGRVKKKTGTQEQAASFIGASQTENDIRTEEKRVKLISVLKSSQRGWHDIVAEMALNSKLGLKDEINLLLRQVQLEAIKMAEVA